MRLPNQNYTVFIVSTTESVLTKRGNRHPALAKFLSDKGYALQYLSSDFYHAEKRWFSKEEIEKAVVGTHYKLVIFKCLGYKKNISPRRIISNIILSLRSFFYLLPRVSKEDIVVIPSRPVELIFLIALLRILKRNSVLLDIRDVWPDMLPPTTSLKKYVFYFYCNLLLYPSLRFIDKFMHTAPFFTQWLKRYAHRKTSTFIPLGYDRFRWEGYSKIRSFTEEKLIEMVCVAKLQHQIDCTPVVEALIECINYNFTIIGEDGSGPRYIELSDIIENNNMKNVVIAGKVHPEKVPEMLYSKHIGVVPMISPSIPNKVFDYIASGLPILVLGDYDSSSFVLENDIGWACAYKTESVKDLLKNISFDEIRQKSENVLKIQDNYSRELLFRKVEELMNNGIIN